MTAPRDIGTCSSGETVHALELERGPLRATVWTLGATLADLRLHPYQHPLILAPSRPDDMKGPMQYAGAIVGPVANRLRDATALIAGKKYQLPANETSGHVVHCGSVGVHGKVWRIEEYGQDRAVLHLDISDMEDGLPGNRVLSVSYVLSADGLLELTMDATSDAHTAMNLAHHPYWSLDASGDISNCRLNIDAPEYLPTDEGLIPFAQPAPVDNTHFDFRTTRRIGRAAIDNNYCLSSEKCALRPAASLSSDDGPTLTIETTERGLQVFNGFALSERDLSLLNDFPLRPYAGIALEPQGWPDALGRPDFPAIDLLPRDRYTQQTRYILQPG